MRLVNTNDIVEKVIVCSHCGDPRGEKFTCCSENHFEEALRVGNELLIATDVVEVSDEKWQLDILKKQNEILKAALEYYADKKNWRLDYEAMRCGVEEIQYSVFRLSDFEQQNDSVGYCGKRARQALADAKKVGES